MKIAAVVVTRNRPEMLRKCLDSLQNQTRAPDRIVIVDNASTDETPLFIEGLRQTDDRVVIVTLPTNTGASGGFRAGIERALDLEVDSIWVMDDDAYPDPDCLSQLEETVIPNHRECVCPLIVGTDGVPQLYHHKLHSLWMNERGITLETGRHIYDVSANAFVGPFFTARVVREAGLPLDHFFIWFDDTEFTLRIAKHTAIVVNSAAVIRHQVYAPRTAGTVDWKELYGIRNKYWAMMRRGSPALYAYWTAKVLRSYVSFMVRSRDSWLNRVRFSVLYARLMADAHRDKMDPAIVMPSAHTLSLRKGRKNAKARPANCAAAKATTASILRPRQRLDK